MSMIRPEVVAYASAARTATPTAVTLPTGGNRGCHVVINVTAVTATPSVVPTIDGVDSVTGTAYNLLTGLAITATGITVLKIAPGIGTIANAAASDVLPNNIRLTMTHGDADSITYSVSVLFTG